MAGYIGSKTSVTVVSTETDSRYVNVAGDTMTGALAVNGNLTVDTNTLFVDAANNRVGVGTTSPSTILDLVGNWVSNTGQLSIDTPSGETYSGLAILNNGTPKAFLYHDNSLGTLDLQTYTTDAIRFKTLNTERMRIDASGNVGIGTSSPAQKLHVSGNAFIAGNIGTDLQTISSWTANTRALELTTYGAIASNDNVGNVSISTNAYESSDSSWKRVAGTSAALYQAIYTGDHVWFRTGAAAADSNIVWSESMRLNPSGNLLVGKTSSAFGTAGIEIDGANDRIWVTRSGAEPLVLNRLTNDGNLLEFYKDGTRVGSIGSFNGLTASFDGGVGFSGLLFGSSSITPRDNGAAVDAGIDLGGSSTRFKDLYLSGGVSNPAAGGTLTFGTAGSERMRIDASGNVGIGLTNPGVPLHVKGPTNGNVMIVDATGTSANYIFDVRDDGNSVMRVDPLGNLLVGTTSSGLSKVYAVATGNFHALRGEASTAGYVGVYGGHSVNGSTGYVAYFFNSGSSTGLYMSNTAAWQSISDVRMKEDVRDLNTTERLMQLRPVDYLWKHQATSDEPDRRNLGFIAQEVQQVFPELVSTSPDGMLGVEYTGLISPLVKALQEALQKIDSLEARIATLEGN